MSDYAHNLVPRIRAILQGSDLTTVSAKSVRKQLVDAGEDPDKVKEYRHDIDGKIAEIFDELTGAGDDEDDEDDESSEDEPLTSSKPVKSERKPSPSQIESDAAMAKRMQAEEDAASRGRERRAAAPVKKKSASKVKTKADKDKAKKKKKRSAADISDSDVDDEKPKKKKGGGGGGAFNKELILSDALSAFLHEERLSRPQTVKRIWDYVKANGLQDQSDKRFILCDEPMKTVFHTDKLHMFTMNKILAQHFRDPDQVV